MNSPSTESVDRISRRHRWLSVDYRDLTYARLAMHDGHPRRTEAVVTQCYRTVRRQFLSHYFWSPPRWRVWIRKLQNDRALPDFCIVGPAKSGTSDLAVTVMSHPNVIPPLVKEFLSVNPLDWRPFYPTAATIRRHASIHGLALCPFVGPCLHALEIPAALSALRPNTKIVINLRNPVDLVFSQWKSRILQRDRRLLDTLPFIATFSAYVDKITELFPEISLGATLHYGIYASSVAYWLRAFGEQNVRIFDISDYFTDRGAYFQRVERFLGLPHVPLPPRLPVTNRNPLVGLALPAESSAKLRSFFEPYNRRLWNVIGTTYPW